MSDDDLITIEAAAKRLRIPALVLRRLLQDKQLQAIQTESLQWRISSKDLQAYIDRANPPTKD